MLCIGLLCFDTPVALLTVLIYVGGSAWAHWLLAAIRKQADLDRGYTGDNFYSSNTGAQRNTSVFFLKE